MPKPHASVEKQSTEDWFKVFSNVAESLIAIYRTAGQEIVGQRQALATLPSLINRNESEQRLATRILQECTTVTEAETLVKRTVGNLENECQASEAIFNLKRNNQSLEDFYALLVEKGKIAKLSNTVLIKKFIAELPDNVKPNIQRKFTEYREAAAAADIPNNNLEDLYARARQLFNDKKKQCPVPSVFTVAEAKERAEQLEQMLHQQNETISSLQDKLDAFTVREESSERQPRGSNTNKWCNHCKIPGHTRKECWKLNPEQRPKGERGVSDIYPMNDSDHTAMTVKCSASDVYCNLNDSDDIAVIVKGSVNGKKKPVLIDTGAGPCVIDIPTLDTLGRHDRIDFNGEGKKLNGVGSVHVVGTVTLEVSLHPQVKKKQLFNVVHDLGGTILLGRTFLKKFEKLEVNWKKLSLKIGDFLIQGQDVVQGGCAESRAYVAQNKVTTLDSMKKKVRSLVQGYCNLDTVQKQKLTSLLENNVDLFSEDPKCPPEAQLVSHVVDTRNAQPIADKTRRFSPHMAAEIGNHVTEMLKNGICRPSKSPWSSQVLLTKKKDGTMRFVIDYRKLNDITVKDDYPMPNIRDLIDEVNGSKFFSCMDMPSAYWHVPMDKQSIAKTAFQVPQGKFEMLRMPYGMKNSQATQQRLMDQTLEPVKNTRAYVDNTFTHSVEFNEHLEFLKQTFRQLRIQLEHTTRQVYICSKRSGTIWPSNLGLRSITSTRKRIQNQRVSTSEQHQRTSEIPRHGQLLS